MRLAIIGSAGRNDDTARFAAQPELFHRRMLDAARAVVRLVGATTLVSGGAAWADHVAVQLFLEDPALRLRLLLPAILKNDPDDELGMQYLDNGGATTSRNPGREANRWHIAFRSHFATTRPGWSPFRDLRKAFMDSRASVAVFAGFSARNAVIAHEADFALAMTFGHGPLLKPGGTTQTMREFLATHSQDAAFHLDLSSMRLCRRAQVIGNATRDARAGDARRS